MTNTKLVTIAIPAYNTVRYLPELKSSLDRQDFQNFQVLCIDDGSTDGTSRLFDDWALADSRYISIHKSNGGLSSARNAALSFLESHPNSQTEYLMFVDSDDRLSPEALSDAVERISNLDLDVLYFTAKPFSNEEGVKDLLANYTNYYSREKNYDGIFNGRDYFAITQKNGDFLPSACLQIIRCSFLFERKIKFYEGIIHEDNLFTSLCLLYAHRVGYLNKALYERRIRKGSIVTSATSNKNVLGYFTVGCELLKTIHSQALSLSDFQRDEIERFICSMFNAAFDLADEINDASLSFEAPFESILYDQIIRERLWRWREKDRIEEQVRCQVRMEIDEAVSQKENWLRSSVTWRVGNVITWIPRKIKTKIHGIYRRVSK